MVHIHNHVPHPHRWRGKTLSRRRGAALLVANHISYADAVLVGYPTPRIVRFVIWQTIYDVPFFNYFFRILRTIPIDAASPKTTVRALRAARAELGAGHLVAIFPEGAISRNGLTEAFERGYEKLLGAGSHMIPVIPIHISGLYGHPLSCAGGAAFKSWQKLWRPVVRIRIGLAVRERVSPEELRQIVEDLGISPPLPEEGARRDIPPAVLG